MSRKYIPKADKKAVRERANYCCEYCQSLEDFATEPFSIEHIVPLVKDGLNEISNLALACLGCNSYKHIKIEALDPESDTIVFLFHPREQDWTSHFERTVCKLHTDITQSVLLSTRTPILLHHRQQMHPSIHRNNRTIYIRTCIGS